LRNVGGELRLACVNENIRNLISITKLNTIFQTCATVDDAVVSF
jgi:anti-anti-sigma regulatory factor